jgi:hypothetical protein
MTALLIFIVILGVIVFAAGYGVDSRFDRPGRQF